MKNFTHYFFLFFSISFGVNSFSQDLGPNIALGKPTSQSTTGWGGDSWKAVDGNTSGFFDNDEAAWATNSVTHTATPYLEGTTEWWRVDLGAAYDLRLIRIYNRTEEAGRLEGAEVFVGIEGQNIEDYRSVGTLRNRQLQDLRMGLGTAQYISVRQQGILSLAEVEVYAFPSDCPLEGTPCDDGNPNTINDVEDGDCNCAGTVVVCEDLSLAYQINDGSVENGVSEITVAEGDNVLLSLNLAGIEYSVLDPSEDPVSPALDNISYTQAGIYSLRPILNPVVIYVDSEEYLSEDGNGEHAVDDDPNTIWHTEWTSVDMPHPHEIIIDLRAESNVSGLEYLPRQDGTLHGMIAEYEVYISNSPTSWDSPIASGYNDNTGTNTPWAYDASLKAIDFAETQGRYVRLVALSEGDGNSWASAAEIRVISEPISPCVKTIQINVGTGYIYDGTWSPSDPNTSTIGPNDKIRIESGDAVISSDISCYSVTVAPGAGLTIEDGASLSATATTLLSHSDSYSSLILNGEINGTVNYERYVNLIGTSAGGGNDLISAPLANQTFGAFAAANPDDLAASGNLRAFAPYNTAAGAYQNYDVLTNATTTIDLGKGFRAASNEGSHVVFTGTPVKTNVSVPVSDAAAGNAWNLIGNPYPSYLDFGLFFEKNKDQFDSRGAYQSIYGYTGVSGVWTVWNQATIEDPNFNTSIAPGQGFFVKAKPGGGEVSFEPEMRIAGSSDDFIAGRPNKNLALSKLKLSRTSGAVSTSIYFIEGATKGLDPGYDAAGYDATTVDFSLFTNLVEDHTGLDIAIQSLPYEDYNDVIVPLGMKAKAGAKLRIGIDELSTLPENINVYLEDTQNNTLTLLNADDFTFTPTEDINGAGRFNVHYSARTLSIADLDANDNLRIFTTETPKNVVISGHLSSATTAHLYDIQGRLVLSQKLNPSTTENTMDISTMTTGVYVVKLNNDHQIKTQKVIIK